ncbi:MAG: efflux RND transporter periplasmic adaptor subunit [Candidatus Eisenbacteria bacterium]|nr:efflux RND transporter periplasmic adaptor subunit [Candidatus Latescibacterota bacterium]MBD3302166.1 efflux RND transporter periplasmic adaptor subunit [Candidatus Eisenbacteria bacterium]
MARPSKRTVFLLLAAVLLVVIVVANLIPKKGAKGPEVRTEPIETRRIEAWIRAPGIIEPVQQVEISSNVMGRVAEVAVAEGDRVARGDLLLQLDDERYRSLVQQTRAQIQSAEAQLVLAQAEHREAEQNRDRVESLAERGLASEQERIAARTRAEVTEARVAAAREEIRRARAALEQAEKDLRETTFLSPMDGIVTSLNIEEGENVITGTMNNPGTVILTVADLEAMEVVADVDETDVIHVRVGQKGRVLVDALPDTVLTGKVTRVGQSGRGQRSVQQEATDFEVAVLLDDPPAVLRTGMNADVEILTGTRDDALAVPLQALTARPPSVVARWERERAGEENGGDGEEGDVRDTTGLADRNLVEGIFLLEQGEQTTARFVPVELGLRGETHVAVAGDLEAGEALIVGPYRTLRNLEDADPVRADEKEEQGDGADETDEDGGRDEDAEG